MKHSPSLLSGRSAFAFHVLAALSVSAAAALSAGCASSDAAKPQGSGGTTITGPSGPGSDAGGADGGGATPLGFDGGTITPQSGCTQDNVEDQTAASAARTVDWTFKVGHPCQAIKAGQDVTIANDMGIAPGNFSLHPISFLTLGGGEAAKLDKDTGKVTFPGPGTYSFQCGNHPAMKGAIYVF